LALDFIAHGRTADVALYGSGKVVKLFKEGFPRSAAEEEYRVTLLLHGLDVAVPQPYALIELDGRSGIVYEQIDGSTMLEAIAKKPLSCLAQASRMADVHAAIHSRAVGRKLPGQKESLRSRIEEAPCLTRDEKERLFVILDSLPAGDQLCHGDYHPDNVMIGERAWVLDWMTVVSGNPAGDVMRTTILLKYGTMPDETPRMTARLVALFRRAMLFSYMRRYRHATRMRMKDIDAWFLPIAAARLVERIPESEKALLLREIRKRLHA